MMVMWKNHIPAGKILRGIQAHMDIFTLAAAAGVEDVAADMLKEKNNTSMA
jgi:arylsulfatase